MNEQIDDFNEVIKGVVVEKRLLPFKLKQLKLERFHWNSKDVIDGMSLSSSIELISKYDIGTAKTTWNIIYSHTYVDWNSSEESVTDTSRKVIENPDNLIKELENIDLRQLKNNYFSEEEPYSNSYWELSYNDHFKIRGTYDQEIPEVRKIGELLGFANFYKDEITRVQKKAREEDRGDIR